jgi:long-chain acyl-CoA synthetase
VNVDTREVVPFGTRGEIQVRGPQLMRGYLGRDEGQDFDADGWFSTGDIGYIDEDGFLFVVDRLKDTFKCDNWLVSPSEIERILLRHPAVSDCVVFDHPDDISGAVAYALVIPSGDADPGELAEFVNKQVPYYEQIQHITLVDEIARSATGKVQRRDVRDRFLATRPQ